MYKINYSKNELFFTIFINSFQNLSKKSPVNYKRRGEEMEHRSSTTQLPNKQIVENIMIRFITNLISEAKMKII